MRQNAAKFEVDVRFSVDSGDLSGFSQAQAARSAPPVCLIVRECADEFNAVIEAKKVMAVLNVKEIELQYEGKSMRLDRKMDSWKASQKLHDIHTTVFFNPDDPRRGSFLSAAWATGNGVAKEKITRDALRVVNLLGTPLPLQCTMARPVMVEPGDSPVRLASLLPGRFDS